MGDMQGIAMPHWRGALPANMEPAAAFVARADRWWSDTVLRVASARAMHDGELRGSEKAEEENVLVVSHGGLMHVLLQNLIESRKLRTGRGVDVGRYRFPNASVTVIEVEKNGKGTVQLFADTTHLETELLDGNADIVE